jgi:adenylate cyclase
MEKCRLSVAFIELTNFGKLVEAVDDATLVNALQAVFAATGDVITRHHGRIWKYIGDAVLATFPDPEEANTAAHEIAALSVPLTAGVQSQFYVAVATGDVTVATIGHASHRVDDIFGKTVNHAAELLKNAKTSPARVAFCP